MNDLYRHQVALLIKIMPSVYRIKDFAVHGGTAINLFHKNMPRYSVDIDLTYIPIQDRKTSLDTINRHLVELKKMIERTIPNIRVVHKPDVWKLQCSCEGATVKIEVNGTKRGIIGDTQDLMLCKKAQDEFQMACKARTVSFSQLYGGKLTAALSRQHPRDLFDCEHMEIDSFEQVKDGFLLCLLGSDKPIIESLQPHAIDQTNTLEKQFDGMSDIPFSYSDYEKTRSWLVGYINDNLTDTDKQLLLSFEQGSPDWSLCSVGDLSVYPSVKWKLQNIEKLKSINKIKFEQSVAKLKDYLLP